MTETPEIKIGEIKKFIENDFGGWFLLWTTEGRYRADSNLFQAPPEIGAIVSFIGGEKHPGAIRRVLKILFQEDSP